MVWHNAELNEVLGSFNVDPMNGLDPKQAQENLQKYGENRLAGKPKKTTFQRFMDQFKDVMVIILIIAAIISLIVAFNGTEKSEFLEPFIILGIVILNATMGVVQESKAEKALEALQSMSAPTAKVLRGGVSQVVAASEVVPGDICLLEAGDFIPADGRLIEAASLKCEESALTGESVPVEKDCEVSVKEDAPLGDRLNMIYSGCSVAYGRGKMVVTGTGMETEMGKIAKLLDEEEESETPLQHKLAEMGKNLGFAALAICAVIFVIGLLDGIPMMEIFITSVSLAVAAIPEGLPAIVTIVLAMGVQRMVKENAIVRRLPAVETLGSASVICSDKTGTLTQNRMTLMQAYTGGSIVSVEGSEPIPEQISALLQMATLCCDGKVEFTENGEHHIGDPTETAIVYCAHKHGLVQSTLNELHPRVGEIPFDSDRKLMTTINMFDGKPIAIVKGAFDVLLSRCVSGNAKAAEAVNAEMSSNALRVLAVAYKELDSVPENPTSEELECGLNFVGLVGMIDPPRPEAKKAVALCRQAGIRPVMITGDHVLTASAIAKDLGILREGDQALTGADLNLISDEELVETVVHTSVYARVSPEDKIRIVKAWQARGQIVAMTGDGVNDAPALKAADIGCAMGITGTDVAKGAADMILTDDNFATIVQAVEEGRGIYDNIKKAVKFLISCNIGEIFSVLVSMLLWKEAPLAAIQLLWINLVTDSLPALALGVEPVEKSIMFRNPKPKDEGVFAHGLIWELLGQGIMFAALTLVGYYIGRTYVGFHADQTMAFLVLSSCQLFHAFNERSSESLLKCGVFTNKYMIGAFLVSFALIAVIAFTPLTSVFGLVILPMKFYGIALLLALTPVLVVEICKALGLMGGKRK